MSISPSSVDEIVDALSFAADLLFNAAGRFIATTANPEATCLTRAAVEPAIRRMFIQTTGKVASTKPVLKCAQALRSQNRLNQKTYRKVTAILDPQSTHKKPRELVELAQQFRTSDPTTDGSERTCSDAKKIYSGVAIPPWKIRSVMRPTSRIQPEPVER